MVGFFVMLFLIGISVPLITKKNWGGEPLDGGDWFYLSVLLFFCLAYGWGAKYIILEPKVNVVIEHNIEKEHNDTGKRQIHGNRRADRQPNGHNINSGSLIR